jgi:hypothetical protein
MRVQTWNISAFLLPCLWPVYIKAVLISDTTEVSYAESVMTFDKDLEGARLESWPEYRLSQINQPTRCNNFSRLLLDVYLQLHMFRASSRPSSRAQVAASGYTVGAWW